MPSPELNVASPTLRLCGLTAAKLIKKSEYILEEE